jgi:hypothetical protein
LPSVLTGAPGDMECGLTARIHWRRLAQRVRAPALQAGQISSKSLLRLRLLSSSHPWPAPKLIQNYKLRLIHVRGMRRKGHPYRQRQISAPEEAAQQIKILRRYRPTRPSPIGSTGLHKVTSSESRGPDLQVTQHSRKDTNYKAAVAKQCPVRKRWEHEGSLGTCTVLVPRPRGEMFIGVILNPRPLGFEGNGGR